jgi:NADH:ubiquinone oxidoreductase subunit F (NADH-binding)
MAQQLARSAQPDELVSGFVDHANLLSRIMRTTSICGLGQVASEPFRTYLKFFYQNNK